MRLRRRMAASVGFLAVMSGPARGQSPVPAWTMEAGASRERYLTDEVGWAAEGRQDIAIYRRHAAGSVGIGAFRASRFGRSEGGAMVDAYRTLWPRAYGNIRVQLAPGGVVLPESDVSAEVYQALTGGWEPSAGVRRLGYPDPVIVGSLSVGKYVGDRWFGRIRGSLASRRGGGGGASGSALARRYLGSAQEFVELAAGAGEEAVIAGVTAADAPDVDIRRTRFVEAGGRRYFTRSVGGALTGTLRSFEGIPDHGALRLGLLLRW